MSSVGASAAQGLQAGWNMGMQVDQAERQRERDAFDQQQRTQEFGLRQQQYDAQQARQQTADEYSLLGDEHKQLLSERAAMEAAGQAPTPEFNQRVIQNRTAFRAHIEKRRAPMLAAEQSEASRMFADLQSGNLDPATIDPAKFYRSFSLATRMTPKDLSSAVQGAQLVQQGHDAGNQQMVLQGVNQLAANDLKAGVGSASPHGGVITRKEIVNLLPVKDANGVEHPDKVFPIVRTYVMHPSGAGDEDYYDAPLTQNRSSDPNDPPKAVDLAHAFDYMGKVGALAQLLQHPEVAAKLADGEKAVGAQTQADVDEMNALGKSALVTAAKGADGQFYMLQRQRLDRGEITRDEFDKSIAVRNKTEAPAKAPTGLAATMAAVDARTDLTPEEKTEQKTLATPGQSPKAVAKIKAASALENTRLRVAAKATAAKATAAGVNVPTTKSGEPLTGEAFLKTLNPADAIMVRRIVQGTSDPKNIQSRGGERTKYMLWAGLYDPEFNESDFGTAKNTERAFTTGVEGRKVRSFNVALEHLDSLKKAAEAIKNKDMVKFNEIANWWGTQVGEPAPTTFGALAQIVGAEVTGAVVAGGGGVTERREMEKHFNTNASPEQYLGVHNGLKDLMGGQLKGLYQQYTAGQGKKDFNDFLTSGGKGAARDLGVTFKAPPRWGTPGASRPSTQGMGTQPAAPQGGSGTPTKSLTPQDQQAIGWAKANPNDPRAAKILQMHGM